MNDGRRDMCASSWYISREAGVDNLLFVFTHITIKCFLNKPVDVLLNGSLHMQGCLYVS